MVTISPPITRPVLGVFWMLVTGVLFVGVTAAVKHLGTALPSAETAFLRYALGLVFVAPMIRPMIRAGLDLPSLRMFGIRGVLHGMGVMLWFYAMTRISIAEVTALNYLSPVFVTIGAALFLGERLAARRIAAVGVALLGALVILRPGVQAIGPGHMAMLGTGLLFAGSYLIAKAMTDRAGPIVVVGWLSVGVTVFLAPFAIAVWVWPTWGQIGWMFLIAALATGGHTTMTLAFKAAPMAVTQPVTFLQLVWAAIIGVALFAEPLDIWVVLGGTLVMAAVSFITWREAMLKRRAVTPPAVATKV